MIRGLVNALSRNDKIMKGLLNGGRYFDFKEFQNIYNKLNKVIYD